MEPFYFRVNLDRLALFCYSGGSSFIWVKITQKFTSYPEGGNHARVVPQKERKYCHQ
jgi:hypothetical protein